MTFAHHERLGRYRDRPYFLSLRAEPGVNDPEEFAVVLYYDTTAGERVQVARIDTDHGYTHIDRLYRRDESKDPRIPTTVASSGASGTFTAGKHRPPVWACSGRCFARPR